MINNNKKSSSNKMVQISQCNKYFDYSYSGVTTKEEEKKLINNLSKINIL